MSRRDQRLADFDEAVSSRNWLATSVLVGIIGLIAGVAGFVAPRVISSAADQKPDVKEKRKQKPSGQQAVFVPFGDVVVNLAEERLTRQLQIRITLLLAQDADAELVEQALASERAVLMNWLIGYLSDKSLEEVRGAAGVNRARRDIQDRFNSLLFADGSEKVRDVLFEEFTVR
jgi:flagellar FliL protein